MRWEKYLAGKITAGFWPTLHRKEIFLMIRSLILILLLPLGLHAQYTYVLEENVSVSDIDNNPVPMPWAGGLNAAQYNLMDLNLDGKDDLVLFDRTADKIITFLNQDNAYIPAPEYEGLFPEDITNWLLLRDANCDGKKDIFTGNNLGIKVYMNVTQDGGNLEWEHFLFSTGAPGSSSPVLLTKGFTAKVNLQLQFDDLPAIVDADGDGDLDIFNVRFVGNGTVEYHQNFSVERYGTCDSLDFERVTQKWGNFTECDCGVFAFNGSNCPPITGGRVKHAAGKSLLALDSDGDSRMDLLFSEATCTNLFLLKNQGSLSDPVINASAVFPADDPVNFLLFPAAFYEDLDFDGKKDLVAIPNIFTKTFVQTDFARSNWFYKNTGSAASPAFTFSRNNFLQESMIDVGDNSVPAFIDADGDGDFDMFVSQNTSENIPATIKHYENIGTTEVPAFRLVNDDVWQFSQSSFYNLKIQFVDISHDGNLDLAFTATSLQSGFTRLYYVPGSGNGVINFAGQSLQTTGFTIAPSENIYVTNIDNDGFVDLLVGRATGALEFWKNNADGSVTFSLSDNSYLGLGSTVLRQNISCIVADLDGNGTPDLAYSDQNGRLFIVESFRDAVDASNAVSEIIFNDLFDRYEAKNLGGRIWPTAVNLFNTTQPALVVGNVLGGLSILRHDEGQALPEDLVVNIYPNPVSRNRPLVIKLDRPAFMQTFSSLGQELSPSMYMLGNEEHSYNVSQLAAGVYIFRFTIDEKSFARRVVVY